MKVITPRHLRIEQMLAVSALALPAGEADAYRKIQTDLGNSELVVTETVSGGKFVGPLQAAEGGMRAESFWTLVTICVIAAALIAASVFGSR
jgi:hypothetical protein